MPRLCWLLAALLLAVPSRAWSDAAPPAPPTVERLIEQLGDREFANREKAARAIEALGAEALPALLKARNHKDAEVRRRIEQWLPQLERSNLVAPKLVSVHQTGKPVREALDAIAQQTGYKIELFKDPVREKEVFSFNFDKVPFWEAMDRICDACGAVVQPSYGDEILRLQYQDRFAPFVCRHGAFRVSGQSLDYGRSIQFGSLPRTPMLHEPQMSEFLRFSLTIAAEPRLPLLGVDEPSILEAYDDLKHPMLPPAPNHSQGMRRVSHYWGGYRTNTMTAQVNLGNASRGAKMIKLLRGTMPLTLIAEQRDVVVTDELLKAKGKKAKAAHLTIEIQDVKETPNKQYEVKMLVVNDAANAAGDYNWYNSLYYRTHVRDEKGNKFNIFGSNMSINNNTSAQVTFTFGQNGGAGGLPAKLIYQDWTTIQHAVPFEFRDLPLP